MGGGGAPLSRPSSKYIWTEPAGPGLGHQLCIPQTDRIKLFHNRQQEALVGKWHLIKEVTGATSPAPLSQSYFKLTWMEVTGFGSISPAPCMMSTREKKRTLRRKCEEVLSAQTAGSLRRYVTLPRLFFPVSRLAEASLQSVDFKSSAGAQQRRRRCERQENLRRSRSLCSKCETSRRPQTFPLMATAISPRQERAARGRKE